MPVASILAAIDAEIDTLEKARLLLSSIEGAGNQAATHARKVRKRRRLSAKARKAIADAQRKRWAAAKGAVNTTPVEAKKQPAAPAKKGATRKMSAEAKKRIAMAQKKRWAAVRAQKKSTQAVPAGQPTKKISPSKSARTKKAGKAPAAKAAKKAPPRKAAPAKETPSRKAPAAKTKKAALEKAAPTTTAAVPF